MPNPVNTPIDFVELYLATVYTDGDTTLDLYAKNDTYKLTDQKTSSLVTSFRGAAIDRDDTDTWMAFAASNVVENGLFGTATRYTVTLRTSDGANPMVGLANTDDGTSADGNIITANKLASLPADSLIIVPVGTATFTEMWNEFAQNTDELTAVLGETIAELKVVAIDKSDSLLYKFDYTDSNHTRVGVLKVGNGGVATDTKTYIRQGGLSAGHTGLTAGVAQYADKTTPGDITETANEYKIGDADAAGTSIGTAGSNFITSFNDNTFDVHDQADSTKTVEFELSGATTGKTLTLDSNHTDDRTLLFPDETGTLATTGDFTAEYYGDGSDGALDTTGGAVNIALDTLKQYSSMIVHTNALSTAGSDGVMFIRCQGDCTISDSGLIDLSGKGAAGGASAAQLTASDSATSGTGGTNATTTWILDGLTTHEGLAGTAGFGGGEAAATGGGGGASRSAGSASTNAVAGGTTATAPAASVAVTEVSQLYKQPWSYVGAGAASGGQATDTQGGTHRAQGGAGGAGGAGLILYVGGNLTLSTATSVDATGAAGGAGDVSGGSGNRADAAGGGGGGGGGGVLIFVNGTITGDTTKVDVTGGAGGVKAEDDGTGAGVATATNGGAGGAGFALIQKDHS